MYKDRSELSTITEVAGSAMDTRCFVEIICGRCKFQTYSDRASCKGDISVWQNDSVYAASVLGDVEPYLRMSVAITSVLGGD